MPKGNSNRFRAGGNGRAGLRDTPAELRRILQACIADPRLLDGLPPNERELRQAQIQAYEATKEMRRAATKAGWEVRRARETARLIDLLVDAGDDAERVWDGLTPRQQQLVDEGIDRDMAAKRRAPK